MPKLFPAGQVVDSMQPYYHCTRYCITHRPYMTGVGATKRLGMEGAKDREVTTNPGERFVQTVEVEGGNKVQGPPGVMASKLAGRGLHGGVTKPIGDNIIGRMRTMDSVSHPNPKLDGQWRVASAVLIEGKFELYAGAGLTQFAVDGFPIYIEVDQHGVPAYSCPCV